MSEAVPHTVLLHDAVPSSFPSRSPLLSAKGSTMRRSASHERLASPNIGGRSRRSSSASQQEALTADLAQESHRSSGRSTPEQRRRTGKALTSSLLATDAKYKKYAAKVDRCLQSFESVNEWADFISFLSRLLKTLQSPSEHYNEIPRKLIVSKRLAQCLNPALPSGVHQRALDVYAYIFSVIGMEGLRRDLVIWSSGLFPFFQFAATSVRPILINIFEKYYLPLGHDLRPATKAFILALLPGMEEETGDFFDRVLTLLGRLSDAVSPSFVLQNIFLVLISSPSSRLSALNYLGRKMLIPPDPEVMTIDAGLIIRGVALVLEDENVLVRRGGLDLLLRVLRLDGDLMREAESSDKELLVRAAAAVVLQRDLSLTRRVYTWFLGPEEASYKQVEYFRQNGHDLLAATLRVDMASASATTDITEAQRPFKIFLSLLDKWEIGSVLSDSLAISALQAIKTMAEESSIKGEEVLTTATAVYDAIEPIIVWKALFVSMRAELDSPGSSSSNMIRWLLTSLPQHDEEVKFMHVPVILDWLLSRILEGSVSASNHLQPLELASLLLSVIPQQAFTKTPGSQAVAGDQSDLIILLYLEGTSQDIPSARVSSEIIPSIVYKIFAVNSLALVEHSRNSGVLLRTFEMTSRLIEYDASAAVADIDGHTWLQGLIGALPDTSSFSVVDAIIVSALKASRCTMFKPRLEITGETIASAILGSLFRFLKSEAAPFHHRAVELLSEYNHLAGMHTLENVVARRMTSMSDEAGAFDAFGVLWRLTDDSTLPGEIFSTPMFAVLEGLKSQDPELQHIAETWMRRNLRSYFRVLDPIISRLITSSAAQADGAYRDWADLAYIQYLLDCVMTLFRFDGQTLSKECQSTELSQSHHPAIINRTETETNSASYMDLLVDLLIRSFKTEAPLSSKAPAVRPYVVRIQSVSLDMLQTLVSRGDMSASLVDVLKVALLGKLEWAIEHRRLTLQGKMLRLLESALSATAGLSARRHRRSASLSEKLLANGVTGTPKSSSDFYRSLVGMIVTGLSASAKRPVLEYWVDFAIVMAPRLQRRTDLLASVCQCVSALLRTTMLHLRDAYDGPSPLDCTTSLTDAEPKMLLDALERIVTLLSSIGTPRQSGERTPRPNEGGGGLFGMMSGVFVAEAAASPETAKLDSGYLDDAINALLVTWGVTADSPSVGPAGPSRMSAGPSRMQVFSNIRRRVHKVLERIFRALPSNMIGSCVNVWSSNASGISDDAIFDCIDSLTPSAQRVIELVSENVNGKQSRNSIADYQPDPALMAFLEAYTSRLEAPIAVQVWPTLFSFAREILGSAGAPFAKAQLYPVLCCLTILAKTVSTTSALEDRRLRRDLQDIYAKCLDVVVANASRISNGSMLDRNAMREKQEQPNGHSTEAPLIQIYRFIAESVLPNLRAFLLDSERVNTACTSISASIVVPAFRQQKVDAAILLIVLEISKISSATKAWRLQVSDAFNDARFFRVRLQEALLWKPLICALMDSDRERFAELLGRITAAPSANIFTNREQEMVARSLSLRRLSFVLFAAEDNHYLTQLPSIQEKLVEILRTDVVSPRVHSEVYLCLRVLMCRIGTQHLTNFWPIILAELLRIFEATMDEPPLDGSEALQLVLAACKFLDLLLVIQSEDFQIHQWMFVTDTTDAAYPPEEFTPEGIMDRLSEILSENNQSVPVGFLRVPRLPIVIENLQHSPASLLFGSDDISSLLRRPRLNSIRTLTSLHQLQPFFSRASVDTFEGVYSNAKVDWDAVEDGLLGEIFQGRDP